MTDTETAIKNLERCVNSDDCGGCPYIDKAVCKHFLMRDVLELLKDQQTTPEKGAIPYLEGGGMTWFFVCGNCNSSIGDRDKYCRECGRKVVWS